MKKMIKVYWILPIVAVLAGCALTGCSPERPGAGLPESGSCGEHLSFEYSKNQAFIRAKRSARLARLANLSDGF